MLQHLLNNVELQKAILLLLPLTAWIGLFVSCRFSAREYAGSFLAYAWQLQTSLLLNILFSSYNFWSFNAVHHLFYGVPLDVMIGQAILLGGVSSLLRRRLRFFIITAVVSILFFVIYFLSDIVVMQPTGWIDFLITLCICFIPALKLAEWTADDRHLYARSILQAIIWVCLLLWFIPSSIFQNTGHGWQLFLNRPLWMNTLYLVPLLIPAVLIVSALWQFAIEGRGTAFPYDPPKNLVTKGVYAYLANPMQVGICLLVAWWGVVVQSCLVSLSAAIAVFLFVVFKNICNGSCAIGTQDPNWELYQQSVPYWIPRRTAWKLPND